MKAFLMMSVMAVSLLVSLSKLRASTTYPGEGLVVAVDRGQRRVTISHREIPGYMPAMSMPFAVAKGESLTQLSPGSRITFELVSGEEGAKIRHIKIMERTPLPGEAFADKPLEKEVRVGEAMPAITGLDQDGRSFDSSSLRGRVVVVDFIYTRCPMADACPRLSAHFAYLQKHFGERAELVSVTLDPQWDQPAVLAEYAKRWAADTARWHFITGDMTQMRRLAERFGMRYWVEEDAITHTSSVGIITRDGRLAARVDGTQYPVRQLADLVEAQLDAH
jgi:protein SCO1